MLFSRICSVLGTPDKREWPEGYTLAAGMNFRFPQFTEMSLESLVPNCSTEGITLLRDMLSWNPSRRPTGTAVSVLDTGNFNLECKGAYLRPCDCLMACQLRGLLSSRNVFVSTVLNLEVNYWFNKKKSAHRLFSNLPVYFDVMIELIWCQIISTDLILSTYDWLFYKTCLINSLINYDIRSCNQYN